MTETWVNQVHKSFMVKSVNTFSIQASIFSDFSTNNLWNRTIFKHDTLYANRYYFGEENSCECVHRKSILNTMK